MALEMVQPGYRTSLYPCPLWWKTEETAEYQELLANLTKELEQTFQGRDEEPAPENSRSKTEEKSYLPERKKEWEEVFKHSIVLEVLLRQLLENGLGQHREKQQEKSKRHIRAELDNEFSLTGLTALTEGKQKNSELNEEKGNSEFLSGKTGDGSEYFSPSGGGRKQKLTYSIWCLTCETECERKKHWKRL